MRFHKRRKVIRPERRVTIVPVKPTSRPDWDYEDEFLDLIGPDQKAQPSNSN